MKKLTIILKITNLIYLILFVNSVFSQSLCPMRLNVQINNCTCINNGEIKCILTDTLGCQIDTNNIRYSIFSSDNTINIVNSTSPRFFHLHPDNYCITVAALRATGLLGEEAFVVERDTVWATIASDYVPPTIGLLSNEYSETSRFGMVRSWACASTGILQALINNGSYPYTLKVAKKSGGTYVDYRTIVFDSAQHIGSNPAVMDYYEYYDIDSLEVGDYRIYFTDGCGYSLPPIDGKVLEMPHAPTGEIYLMTFNDNPYDSNVVYTTNFTMANVRTYLSSDGFYYIDRQNQGLDVFWQYRIINPSIAGSGIDTSVWKPLHFSNIYDTIRAAHSYCDLWNTEPKLEIRNPCGEIQRNIFHIKKPFSLDRSKAETKPIPELSGLSDDSCSRYKLSVTRDVYHLSFYAYRAADKMFTPNRDGQRKIKYIATDVSEDTVIETGVPSVLNNIHSFEKVFEFDSLYDGKNINIKVLDAKGCNLWDKNIVASAQIHTLKEEPDVTLSCKAQTISWCETKKFKLHIAATMGFVEGDTLELYDAGRWTNVAKAYFHNNRWYRLDTCAHIAIYSEYPASNCVFQNLRDRGIFTVRYVSGCVERVRSVRSTPCYLCSEIDSRYSRWTRPQFKIEPHCSGFTLTPLSGSYRFESYDDANQFVECDVPACFYVYGNPESPTALSAIIRVGESIDLSVEGNIRIVMKDSLSVDQGKIADCQTVDTTLTLKRPPLEYEYFYSYCCALGDSASTVRTKAKGGVSPYHYEVLDRQGQLLDSNTTGVFVGLPLPHHDTVRLKVTDHCGTSFIYQGQVVENKLIRKAWFDDGASQKSINDSSWCQLFSLPFADVPHHWDGPGGFVSSEINPDFFIPKDSNMSGYYKLSMMDPVCGLLLDSLKLKVFGKGYVPEKIWVEDSICSGNRYQKNGFDILSSTSEILQIFRDTMISAMGDSTFLTLTLLPVYRSEHIDSIIVAGESLTLGSLILSDTGYYEVNLFSQCHCDSIIRLHLMFAKYLPCPVARDFDGKEYDGVRVGMYCWTAENLRSLHYSDGRMIGGAKAYYSYEYPDETANISIFGRLYDVLAARDAERSEIPDVNGNIQGICPEGWLLPTVEDFQTLRIFSNQQLRSPNYWLYEPGNNESGFNALPSGYYDALLSRYCNLLTHCYFWTSDDFLNSVYVELNFSCEKLEPLEAQNGNAYSVRCVKK